MWLILCGVTREGCSVGGGFGAAPPGSDGVRWGSWCGQLAVLRGRRCCEQQELRAVLRDGPDGPHCL